jgi:hypothetical protein
MGIREEPQTRSKRDAPATVALETTAGLGDHAPPIDGAATMAQQVKGQFEVKRAPQGTCDLGDGAVAAHIRFDKRFQGPLEATSVVHMLAVGTEVEGSAAYVALERITGSLDGRTGAFFMQHNGVMDRGQPSLSLTVVPDSGTGELKGLTGRLAIDITDGQHYYTFDYSLASG